MCLPQAAAIVRCYISWVHAPYFSAQPAIVLLIDNGLSIGSLFHARSHLNQSAEKTISSEMFSQGRKHFRFRFTLVLAFAFLLASPTHQSAVSVPNGCVEVAIYIKEWNGGSVNSLDVKFLKHFIACIQELYKIYEETDWKAIQNIIPQNVRDLVRKVPNLVKNATSLAKREGLGFLAVYMLYKTFDLFDRAMSLHLDYKWYRQEFQLLQMELKPVTELIDKELMPLRDHLDSATLQKITYRLINKLSHIHAALVRLARTVYKDLKESASKRRWAAASGLVSAAACVGSLLVGNVPGGIACAAGAFGGISFVSLSATMHKLESLLGDMKIMAMEIEEYRTLLEQMSIPVIRFGVLELFVAIVVILWLRSQRNAQAPQDNLGRDD